MKKMVALLMSLIMVFSLSACGSKNSDSDDAKETKAAT